MTEGQHVQAILRLGDDAMVLGQRLSAWCGHGPILEEDIALSNIALDLIGQARNLYTLAGAREGQGRSEDDLAFFRTDREFLNHLLVEQPNGHFGDTVVRQMLYSAFALERFAFLSGQLVDAELAGIAAKAVKELQYHWEHAAQWVVRLGDGTEESHAKVQESLDRLLPYVGDLFVGDDVAEAAAREGWGANPATLRDAWESELDDMLAESGLRRPEAVPEQIGGRRGIHTEKLSYLLAEMQVLPRTYPDAQW